MSLARILHTIDILLVDDNPAFPLFLEKCLHDTGVPGKRLCVEITEQVLAQSGDTLPRLEAIHAMGTKIAVDDFGTGYSSLSYLSRYPLDVLKLDGSFVWTMDDDPKSKTIARAVIHLAHNLGLSVIAEGIETRTQLAWLNEQGCDMGQGYHLGRPGRFEALGEAALRPEVQLERAASTTAGLVTLCGGP